MNAKEYLNQVKNIDTDIKNIEDMIKTLHDDRITIRSAWPDGQPHGTGTSDPVGETATKLADDLEELEKDKWILKAQLYFKRDEILKTVSKVPTAECKRLLYLRYIKLKTWEEIAVEMHYTYQWVAGGLHSNALQELQKILDNREDSQTVDGS